MRCQVVAEEGPKSFGTCVPGLPGCVAAVPRREQVLALIREAIGFHIEGRREDGHLIPPPWSSSEVVDVHVA